MLTNGQQVGNYVVVEEIGIGGMGIVYKVQHAVLESPHAMKVLLPHLLRAPGVIERFIEEAKIQAQFRHPSMVRVTDIVSEPGIAGLVMDYLEGQTLDSMLLRGPVAPSDALRWGFQICGALTYIHNRGVVHRDIKPANLLVEEVIGQGTQIRLMDFGIAKVHLKDRTRTAVAMGTPAYMSPEQITGARRVDARSDLFSLGAVLYELLAGCSPFEGDTDYAMQQSILSGHVKPLIDRRPELSEHVCTVVHKALSTQPEERFSTARAFGRQLAAAPEADNLIVF